VANFFKGLGQLFTGSPEKRKNVSTLLPQQEPLRDQAINAGLQKGAGGAFGTAADYYRGLFDENSEDYNALSAPALRQYSQDIVPNISEQFAGMGSGGLSSSGFQNAQIQGATDLSERLGALRANLRQSGAQGLQNIGQLGLQNYGQNMVTQPGSEGLLSSLAPAIGTGLGAAIGGAVGGPPGAMIGGSLGGSAGNWIRGKNSPNKTSDMGQNMTGAKTGAYGANGPQASAQVYNPYQQQGGFQLPTYARPNSGRMF